MNKRQKEVLQAQLNSEEEVIAQLKSVYEQALRDCETKIQELSMRADLEPENLKSIIYQKQYQEAIKAQLEGALTNLQSDSYATVSDYLTRSYQDGYLGSMYDMQGQGIPLVMPIDQEAVTRAVVLDSQLSTSLYDRMGEDVKAIKKAVRQEVSRGIAQGMTWSNIASNLARNMKHTPFQKAYNNSIRIARTEGHRIQNRAALDAQKRAIDRGAEVVKQWNAVLDGRTRSEHRELDGQIREVGEMFEIAGYKAEAPGLFGDPSQDCNCRCCLDQRARWALNCGIVKMDNFSKETVAFESPEEYAEWKKVYWSDENIEYMQHVTAMEKKYGKNFEKMLNSMTDKEYEKYKLLLDNNPMYKSKETLVKNAEEAKTALKNRVGFRNCNIDSMDERLIVDNTNQLIRLESKFGVIHKSDFVDIDVDVGNFAGNVNSSRLTPASQYLVLNKKRYSDRDSLIKKEIKDMDSGYSMPFSRTNEEASIATVTHEYGHMLQNVIKKEYMESLGWKNSDMFAFVNKSAKTDKAKYKWYADVQKTVQNNCYDEIIAIAKRNNPVFDLDANISEYGKTSKAEFFAEVFANSQLGKPNELGVAMNDWLNKKYLANSVKNGTITLADINKMITPYERKVLDKIPAKSGYFDFAAHGSPDYIEYGEKGKNMSARDVARVISHNEKYNGQKVRMLSCSTGASDDGFAQQLANSLGVEVEAPTDVLYVYEDGHFKVGYDGSGTMKTFKPQGKR